MIIPLLASTQPQGLCGKTGLEGSKQGLGAGPQAAFLSRFVGFRNAAKSLLRSPHKGMLRAFDVYIGNPG
jgi:hypothetical protein